MIIETVRVFNPSGDGFMIINKKDFMEDIHKLWVEAADVVVEELPVVLDGSGNQLDPVTPQNANTIKRGRPFKR
jgi:hypothetical protein